VGNAHGIRRHEAQSAGDKDVESVSGDMLRETGPLETREEAMTAGNRDLARLEAARSSR
jgi:hypothetical protein